MIEEVSRISTQSLKLSNYVQVKEYRRHDEVREALESIGAEYQHACKLEQ